MKKTSLIITLLVWTISASAASFTVNGINYTTTTANTVEVSSGGVYTDAIVIPSSVTYSSILYNVTSIGNYAFYNCTGLTSISIPSSVTSIGRTAFYNCTGLTSITIPASVTSIGDHAFRGCTGLTNISIPSSVTSIGNSAFYNCTRLTSITIPSSITSIEGSAFRECTGLTSISIPSSVTSIGESSFQGCTGLTSITVPSSVISIGNSAFQKCTDLTSITIPSSVMSIGNFAFEGCYNLANIYSHISTPMSLVNYQFYGINTSTCKLNIPSGAKPLYEAALGWKDFLNIVEFTPTDINQTKATQLTVTPTIATSTITIQTKGSNFSQSLRIFNAQGQLLYETNLVESKVGVDVSNFPTGTYYIKTTDKNSGSQDTGRFIKK